MSFLVVGMSHKSAPIDLLERTVLDAEGAAKLISRATDLPFVSESAVVSTCNRIEVYVETERFHGSVEQLSDLLAERSGLDRDRIVRHLYVHYEESAVAHLFSVASGLDSMVPGESQVLGQVRAALSAGQAESTVGTALNALFQQALRVGKRAHAETGIDALAPSLVAAALDRVALPTSARVVVAGAGSMASLSVATLRRRGYDDVTVVNRTPERAEKLVELHGGRAAAWAELDGLLAGADLLLSCTGANGVVFGLDRLGAAGPLTVVDLALPRDVAPEARSLPGLMLVSLDDLADTTASPQTVDDLEAVKRIVADEVGSFLAARSMAHVKPTVVALRSMATDVVAAELERFAAQHPEADETTLAGVRQAMNRVAGKLIHTPTVRVQQLVDGPDGLTYADALADLFALDPKAVAAVSRVDELDGGR